MGGFAKKVGKVTKLFTDPVTSAAAEKGVEAAGKATGLTPPEIPANLGDVLNNPPAVEPVKPMPVSNDDAVRAARRKSVALQRRRQGRASTILTAANSDTLG